MATKEEYQEALNRMEEAYYNFDSRISSINKFKEDINLLTGLVNEHFEEKVETNYEHYKDEVIEDCMWNLALVKGKPKRCNNVYCKDCEFSTGIKGECKKKLREWLKQPYKKPTCKLTQFEYDLLNAHKDSGMQKCISNYRPLLELYEKGYFKDIGTSVPIHEVLDNCEVIK